MKRMLAIAFAAALIFQAAALFADDIEADGDPAEPSEKAVLQAAREKYRSSRREERAAARAAEERKEAEEESEAEEVEPERDRFTPIQLSFVPGLAVPRGSFDTSVSAGMVGNRSRDVSGVQGSGVFSIARDLRGAQGAGVFNIASGSLRGVQGAGAFNIAGEIRGAQGAGGLNIAREVRGVQMAGGLNVAGRVEGAQIGLVNLAKSIDGVQLGLFNYVVDGIHSIGVAYEPQTSYTYAYWQSGTPSLYTRWSYGAPGRDWELDFSEAVLSFGLGTRHKIAIVDIDLDIAAESAVKGFSFERADDRWWHDDEDDDCGKNDWSWPRSWPRTYPSLRAEASLPIGHHLRVFGGVKADIDVAAWGDRVPEALKAGDGWKGKLWGGEFTVWPKWFVGLKL